MPRFVKIWLVSIYLLLLSCCFVGLAINNRLKHLEERPQPRCCSCEPCSCCNDCSCSRNGCKCASGQHCGALGCKCSVQGKAKEVGVCFFYSDSPIRETPCPKCHKKGLQPADKSPNIKCAECGWHGTTADMVIEKDLLRPFSDWMKGSPLPLPAGGPCPKKKKAALPNPKTPLLTAVIHDGQARIAWIDEDGQRQECTLPEEEFCKLTAKGE